MVMIRRKTPRPRPRTELTWCVRAVSGGDVVRTFVLWRPDCHKHTQQVGLKTKAIVSQKEAQEGGKTFASNS